MRAEIYTIQCTGCDFEEAILDGSNKYIYEGKEERKPALVNYCYCKDCQSVRKVLEPFTIRNLGLSTQEFLSLSRSSEKKSFLGKLVDFKAKEQKSAEEKINKEAERLEYFQNNNYQPRCFHCSSFNIKVIDLPQRIENQKVLIDVTHKCGGQINIFYSGHANLISKSSVRFNENGRIDTEASVEYCKTVANSARIETILEEGLIKGFAIFIDENLNVLKRYFRHQSAQIAFIGTIDKKIYNENYFDDRKQFIEDYGMEFNGEEGDDLNSQRIIVNKGEVFYSWKSNRQEN